jgi:hypothetical protein
MKLDPGMHIGLHLVFFGKTGVTACPSVESGCAMGAATYERAEDHVCRIPVLSRWTLQ